MYGLKLIIICIVFLIGLYFVVKYPNIESFGLGETTTQRCPNVLIQKGKSFYLFNSKLSKIPGVNPLRFESLDDYIEFTEWQRSRGIRCPILFLQETYDAQGNPVMNARPSPTELNGGLQPLILPSEVKGDVSGLHKNVGPGEIVTSNKDMIIDSRLSIADALGIRSMQTSFELPPETKLIDAGVDSPPYNTNSYPSYDPAGLYTGLNTPLDTMFNGPDGVVSANPMDTTWGGIKYTQEQIDSGKISSTRVSSPYE